MSSSSEKTHMNYLKILFRRKDLLIIPAMICLAFGISAGMLMPREYVSSTVLLVEEGKSDNPLFDKIAVSTNVEQRLETIRESMLGWNSLVELVKRLKMDAKIKNPREYESLILGIRKKMSIRLKSRNIIQLAYYGKDATNARDIVKNITEIFINQNLTIQNNETSDAITFIEGQLKVYKGKIKSSEIAALKDQLTQMLVDSTDMHPLVKNLKEQIKSKEAELKKENLEYTEESRLDSQSANPLITEIQKALDNIEGKSSGDLAKENDGSDIYKVMLIDKLGGAMARDVGVNNKIYNMLLQRLETAKITQRLQMSNEGTKYTVLDPPRVPLDPIKPNKTIVALMGLIAGLGMGAGLIFLLEFFDRSFIDVEEAAHFLGAPLIGAISKINTEVALKRKRDRMIWLYILTIVASVAIVVVTKSTVSFMHL